MESRVRFIDWPWSGLLNCYGASWFRRFEERSFLCLRFFGTGNCLINNLRLVVGGSRGTVSRGRSGGTIASGRNFNHFILIIIVTISKHFLHFSGSLLHLLSKFGIIILHLFHESFLFLHILIMIIHNRSWWSIGV